MNFFLLSIFCFCVSFASAVTPSQALERLKKGNQRYASDSPISPDRSSARRGEIKKKQSPFAIVLGCSDSRVPPEIIFDEGLGDLFTVRVAGNVVGPVELDTIEYACNVFGSSLVLVLGHESCGAVTAVFHGEVEEIEAIADLMKPAIANAKDVESAVKQNVRWVVEYLKKTECIKRHIANKKIDVVGAYYHLGTGEVEILGSPAVLSGSTSAK